MKKYERGELAKEILGAFVVGGFVATCVVLPGIAPVYKLLDVKNSRDRERVRRSLKGLKKNGYVKRTIKNGKEKISVTALGEKKIAQYKIDDLQVIPGRKWDKKWRVLMFDIPETKKRVRREVSFKLRDIGMITMQHSVFVSPWKCKREIDAIADHYFVHKYFIYLEADTIETYINLVKKFNVK